MRKEKGKCMIMKRRIKDKFIRILKATIVLVISLVIGSLVDRMGSSFGIHCGSIISAIIMWMYILAVYS